MREGSIPLQNRLSRNRRTSSNTIRLAVDEDGLWVIYTDTYISGRLIISKMNKNTLQIEVRTFWITSAFFVIISENMALTFTNICREPGKRLIHITQHYTLLLYAVLCTLSVHAPVVLNICTILTSILGMADLYLLGLIAIDPTHPPIQ